MDIIGLGNPLLDYTVTVDESFLNTHGIVKGTMKLVDEAYMRKILEVLKEYEVHRCAGGSVGNCLAAASMLGVKTGFMGCLGKGEFGDEYEELTKSCSISPLFVRSDKLQGTCVVLITDDGERSFLTQLGACLDFGVKDLSVEELKECKVLHIEGFQLDGKKQQEAVFEACKIVKENKGLVSVDLSDSQLIARHKVMMNELVIDQADIVFANEEEARSFTDCSDMQEAARTLAQFCSVAVVKRAEKGSIIATQDGVLVNIPAMRVSVVNSNGAGDAYAGAFLAKYVNGSSLEECGRIASQAGALVVSSKESRLTQVLAEQIAHK